MQNALCNGKVQQLSKIAKFIKGQRACLSNPLFKKVETMLHLILLISSIPWAVPQGQFSMNSHRQRPIWTTTTTTTTITTTLAAITSTNPATATPFVTTTPNPTPYRIQPSTGKTIIELGFVITVMLMLLGGLTVLILWRIDILSQDIREYLHLQNQANSSEPELVELVEI